MSDLSEALRFDSLQIIGSAAAPAANAQIGTSLATPAAGVYEVSVVTLLNGGAPVAADLDNMYLAFNGTSKTLMVVPAQNVPAINPVFRITLDGTHNVSVNAAANATAGVTYAVVAWLKRVA